MGIPDARLVSSICLGVLDVVCTFGESAWSGDVSQNVPAARPFEGSSTCTLAVQIC